jgi:serine/threonine-protein kinase
MGSIDPTVDEQADLAPPAERDGLPPPLGPASPQPALRDPERRSPWDRYERLECIGTGGMGEVRRVRDRVLGRVLAMKLLLREHAATPEMQARFLAEARLTACLQHPGTVPVHECGIADDGRLWFAMKEVRGRTLGALIQALHAAEGPPAPEALRRLVDVHLRVCEAVAYAHRKGVIHRDLKPENVMVGEFGEVMVMDWGVAHVASAGALASEAQMDADLHLAKTQPGRVLGTLPYMPPEQARGEELGPAADVYALGAVLYEILSGSAPYQGLFRAVWAQMRAGPPPRLADRCRWPPPEDLVAVCEKAMAPSASDRHADAGVLAEEIRGFLDGARRRDRARARLAEAQAMAPALADKRARARALRREAQALLDRLWSFDPADRKARAWALEDEATALDREADVGETDWIQRVRAALEEAPDLPEARAALTRRYRDDLLAAEEAHDVAAVARAETLIRLHDRGEHATLIRGDGTLTLVTDPEGAEVTRHPFVEQQRRLHLGPGVDLGRTPLRRVQIPRGSHLLRVRAPGRHEMLYPVHIGRCEDWEGVRPGDASPFPVPLLPYGTLGEGDVYVPPGWFLSGGDPLAGESLPGRRLWVDGFVIQRFPVTQADFLAFLDALVGEGREQEALDACPSATHAVNGATDIPSIVRDGGRFRFVPGAPPDQGRHPIAGVDWHVARAYAAYWAARTGRPWRLPGEGEREKAARGVDGRAFPWGNQPEPTWACMVGSHDGAPHPAPVDDYPIDKSPYGMRGAAGNVRDWCAEVWTPAGPEVDDGVLLVSEAGAGDLRSIRGGAWSAGPPAMCRVAGRFAGYPRERYASVGVRLAWSIADLRAR